MNSKNIYISFNLFLAVKFIFPKFVLGKLSLRTTTVQGGKINENFKLLST